MTTGNREFQFTSPAGDINAEIGDDILITWVDTNSKADTFITLLLITENAQLNVTEIVIASGIPESDRTNSFTLDTEALGLEPGTYVIVGRITEGANPPRDVAATGVLNLFAPGLGPLNISPTVVVTQPQQNLAVAQNDLVNITYCGRDRDDGEGGVNPDVVILLDRDNNPLNDLFADVDPKSPEAVTLINTICGGTFPREITDSSNNVTAVVVGCATDDDCMNPAAGTNFPLLIDAIRIPQLPDGEPYRVRVTMWDRTNPPVHAYAPGLLSIASAASGLVDLGNVGRTTSGTRFLGFFAGSRAGSTGTPLGDFDGDGADDFLLVARFGNPLERGNVGSAYIVYGTLGQRYGSDIELNSVGSEYRGCSFAMGRGIGGLFARFADPFNPQVVPPVTEGITHVSIIEDVSGDGVPEILFGLPYVELLYDYYDDDPCDRIIQVEDPVTGEEVDTGICYEDGFPNPLSTEEENDDITSLDWRESNLCSNDGDPFISTYINQGYVIYVRSDNPFENTVIDLTLIGMKDPEDIVNEEGTMYGGGSAPNGALLRGGYFGTFGAGLDSNNLFGETVNSMPDLANGNIVPAKDGESEYLFSIPGDSNRRGRVHMIFGMELASFNNQPVQSLPVWEPIGDPCVARGRVFPVGRSILGAQPGDELGYADRAGDYNLDGHQDILCGAPGADRDGNADSGIVYILFGHLTLADSDLSVNNPPRMEIRGTERGSRFGQVQTLIGDINSDGYSDVAIASETANGPAGTDSGYVGIIFGGRQMTGENVFTVNQIGSAQLPGVQFFGAQTGGHAGRTIANVGDFNGDNLDDLLICAPDETRQIDGQTRRGVAYLIFGGAHLANTAFTLDEVGGEELPGAVFVSPYAMGSADEAPIDWVGAAGDVDGDGYSDILIGVTEADFVNPIEPSQRRIDAGEAYLIYGNNSRGNRGI